jgi:hypothetical protein
MTIGKVGMMRSNGLIILVIRGSRKPLMFGGSLKMIGSLTMMNRSLVVDLMLMLGRRGRRHLVIPLVWFALFAATTKYRAFNRSLFY